MYPSNQKKPSRHFVLASLSLTYRSSSSSSLTLQHGIRARLEGEIDLPCCSYLPCRRFLALLPALPCCRSLPWRYSAPRRFYLQPPWHYSDRITSLLHRVAATCCRPGIIPRHPDVVPRPDVEDIPRHFSALLTLVFAIFPPDVVPLDSGLLQFSHMLPQ